MSKYVTRQRKALLFYLNKHPDEQLSAQEIGQALSAQQVSLSAVYRNLADLEAEGLVRRCLRGASREVYYQYTAAESCENHLHMSCTRCGKTFHMDREKTEHLAAVVAGEKGFTLDKSDTVLYGICAECQK